MHAEQELQQISSLVWLCAREEDVADAEKTWRAACYFLAKGPSATLQFLGDDDRARLYAFQAQALDGPCPPGQDGALAVDPALRRKQEAWRALDEMSRDEAKKNMVDFLSHLLPEWRDWFKKHAEATLNASEDGEAHKLLRGFKARGNSGTPGIQYSRL